MTGVTTTNNAPASVKVISFQEAVDHLEHMRVETVTQLGFTDIHQGELEGFGKLVLCIDASSDNAVMIH